MHDRDVLVDGDIRRYGRFDARPTNVNPLDEFSGLSRALHRLRLKEWVGFTLLHPEMYSSLIMQDAQYLASSEIYAFTGAQGTLFQHAASAVGSPLHLPAELLGSRCAFDRRGYRLEYEFARANGRHRLRFDIAATGAAPAFQGELELSATKASAPLSVSSRLPGGRMYTHKAVFPAQGFVRIGDERIVFDGARDLAVLDEHKSQLPYRTTWLWGTFAQQVAGEITGANFAVRPSVPGAEEESCIWTPGACDALTDIEFEQEGSRPGSPWHMRSRDGRLDVTFEPEGRKTVRHQLGIFAIDYFQLFGRYQGTVRGANRMYEIDRVHGVCESMQARL